MPSDAQIEANRRNAQNSTGPKTQEGKERARRNALRHGLAAEHILLIDEDAEDFTEFAAGMRRALGPVGEAEAGARRPHRHGQLALEARVAPGGGRAQRGGDPHRPRPRARRALRAHPRRAEGGPAGAAARPRDAVAAAAHALLDRARHGQRHERRAGRGSGHLEGKGGRRRGARWRAGGRSSIRARAAEAGHADLARGAHGGAVALRGLDRARAPSRQHRARKAPGATARGSLTSGSPHLTLPLAVPLRPLGAEREGPAKREGEVAPQSAPPLSRQRRRAAERAPAPVTNSAERTQFAEALPAPPAPPHAANGSSPPA